MYFKEAADEFNRILDEENISISDSLKNSLLSIMSEMCSYSEEEHKVRPRIIMGTNIEYYFKTIPSKSYITMCKDDINGTKLSRIFKALALFCDNGWYIVINVCGTYVEYGIFRKYTELNGERFEDYYKDTYDSANDSKMVIISAINNSDIVISRYDREDFCICQKFVELKHSKYIDDEFNILADDMVEKCNNEDKQFIKNCLLKMFRNFPIKLHGTILLVVDDDFEIDNSILSGIRVSPPVDYYETFMLYRDINNYSEAEYVYSLVGVLYEMLNTDGITIVTNKSRVLYYNTFYEGNIPKEIKGGARKRTAIGILENKDLKDLKGIYFQSQDGDYFYARREENE